MACFGAERVVMLEWTSVSNAHLCTKQSLELTEAIIYVNSSNSTSSLALHLPCWLQTMYSLQMEHSPTLP